MNGLKDKAYIVAGGATGIGAGAAERPGDLASVVAFLLSDEAEWINGQVWSIDGGAHMQ